MNLKIIVFCGIIGVCVLVTKTMPSSNVLSEEKLVGIAFAEAKKGMEVPDGIPATISYKNEIASVVWYLPSPSDPTKPRPPGPSYYALVEINRFTGKIIRVLGAP